MNVHIQQPFLWPTAVFGEAAASLSMEIAELGEHMQQCTRAHGRWLWFWCSVDAVHQSSLARFVTTLTALGALAALTGAVVVVW